ncbi:glycosyltransferase family 2 protein [Geobacter argillaceus]|uniref:glycosyltransferase family 2 protein n=1 Tax=Geobacter argillaceus TaxID=345631 RepID=UPI001FEC7B71|nr:glycosyltransferase [Geobacter argillaceus]
MAGRTDVNVISNQENLGCAGAWNQGVRQTASEWLVILNNDVLVYPIHLIKVCQGP